MTKFSGKNRNKPKYRIKARQKKEAKRLGVVIKPSENSLKKIDVFDKEGNKLASIGGRYFDGEWYGDYASYLEKPEDRYGNEVNPQEKRRLYLARHEHEAKFKKVDGKRVRTPSFYADEILW